MDFSWLPWSTELVPGQLVLLYRETLSQKQNKTKQKTTTKQTNKQTKRDSSGAHRLRALAALALDPGSKPSTHRVAHNHPQLQGIPCPFLAWDAQHTCGAGKTPKHIKQNKSKKRERPWTAANQSSWFPYKQEYIHE